jgi:hypothetical protein
MSIDFCGGIRGRGSCACGLVLSLLFLAVVPAHAHTSLPCYLALQETGPGSFDLVWKVPTAEGPPPAIHPVFPSTCTIAKPLVAEQAPGAIIERGSLQCGPNGLDGAAVAIVGLNVTIRKSSRFAAVPAITAGSRRENLRPCAMPMPQEKSEW